MTTLFWLKDLLDFLGGVHDSPPKGAPRLLRNPLFRGLWWGLLLTLIAIFSGQTSKFIYIDF
ncbi:MAG: hypothetical protein QOG61_2687 [Candidatus Binataceae bacterium]|jgi:hypothetical protein|nr:hypothetical protein [Candidatus Binataceae bacterium]MEA2681582.1 hypothetical protein [Candidatus Binataceae bacterium]